jgi:hypothetical protein
MTVEDTSPRQKRNYETYENRRNKRKKEKFSFVSEFLF